MPGNIRRKTGRKGSGVTEADYESARKQCIRSGSICVLCGDVVDKTLKPICRRVKTDGYPVERAHEIPLTCDNPGCAKDHARKPNPWSASADHRIPVSQLKPGDPRLVDPKFLDLTHLVCNIKRKDGGNEKPAVETLKDWGI